MSKKKILETSNITYLIKKNIAYVYTAILVLSLIAIDGIFHGEISKIIDREFQKIVKKESLDLTYDKIDYGYFPPRVILNSLNFKNNDVSLNAKMLSVSLKILPLIKAKIEPDSLYIQKANILVKSKETTKDKPLPEYSFKKIQSLLPFDYIEVEESYLSTIVNETRIVLEDFNTVVDNHLRSIDFQLETKTSIKSPKHFEEFSININTQIEEDSLYFKYVNLQKHNSILNTSGSADPQLVNQIVKSPFSLETIYNSFNELRINMNLDLQDISDFLKVYTEKEQDSSGKLLITTYFNEDAEEKSSKITIVARDIDTPFAEFKRFKSQANLFTNRLNFQKFQLDLSEKSSLKFDKLSINRENETYWVKSLLNSKNIEFNTVLKSLKLSPLDLSSPLKLTDTNCSGSLYPKTGLTCFGGLNVKEFKLDIDGKRFLDLNALSTRFSTQISSKELSFDSSIENPLDSKSTASVNGNIHYVKGFDVNFKSDGFSLNFANKLAGQELNGWIKGVGSTRGSSKWGQFNLKVQESDSIKFNEFYLGKLVADAGYSYPEFYIQNIKGSVENSQYEGNLNIDTSSNSLALNVEGVGGSDSTLREVFKDMFEFPKDIEFDLNDYEAHLNGPLDIKSSNLELKSNFEDMEVYGEDFDQGKIHLKGLNGTWKFSNTSFQRDDMVVNTYGSVSGFETIDIQLESKNFSIQDLNRVKYFDTKLEGPLDFSLNAIGPIEGPKATGVVYLKDTVGNGRENLGDSKINYRLYENQVDLALDVFDETILGKASYPLDDTGQIAFEGKVEELDLFNFINLNSELAALHYMLLSFKSNLTLNIKENRFITKGWIEDFNLKLKDANTVLAQVVSKKRTDLSESIQNYTLVTRNNRQANLVVDFTSTKQLNIFLDGRVDAHSLLPFVPSSEIIEGLLVFDKAHWTVRPKRVIQKGSIHLKNGIFKTNSFPYSFNDINTSAQLNSDKITFEKISARLNNSVVTAKGYMQWQPFFLAFNTEFDDITMTYPEGITSTSSGKLKLTGDNFPLKTEGLISVSKGQFNNDLLTNSDGKTISVNKFLPKEVLYQNSPPFELNILLKVSNKFKVKTSEIDGRLSGSIRLKGNSLNPNTIGSLELLKNMKISFLDKIFAVQEGRINYENYSIDNPEVYVDAQSDVFDSNDIQNKKYSIRMLVKGRAQDPSISFSSQPPLAEKEIISLLTLGTVSTQTVGQEINTQQQATYSGLQVGSFLIQKNKAIRDLQEKTGTEIGITSSVDAISVNPKVQLKKKWSPKLSSTVSQSFGNQQVLSLSTEYNVNNRVSTSINVRNNQTQDASQLINRRVQQGEIFGIDLQYKFEFE